MQAEPVLLPFVLRPFFFRPAILDERDANDSLPQRQGRFNAIGESSAAFRVERDSIDNDLDPIVLAIIERGNRVDFYFYSFNITVFKRV